ncbi:hypothetical protein N9Q14_04365 [Pseudomonadales bacterium]|nr:hypothetical protein [Pseudomonadales bacterium]
MSMLTVPAHLIIDENNIRFAEVASGQSCAGCQKAGCRAKTHRIPVDALDFGLLLANSLGLPLMGLLLGAGLGHFWGLHEGLQFGLAILGLGIGRLSCRAYAQSLIHIRSREETSCSS